MKIPEVHTAFIGSMTTRIMTTVGLALAIGGMSMAPAFGADYGNYENQQQYGANDGYQRYPSQPQQHRMGDGYWQNHGHQWDHRNRQVYRHPGNDYRRGNYYDNRDYMYAPPPVVYAPPPVVYAPQSSPGVSLFIPLRFR
ncbi:MULTISPECIES: hypothetical protein [Burkholderia cepacia complex]|uniref:hypothetical protein n=1 Tax=Burkholderia cepacia complex TaxID=87882 RepID=UPI00195883B0|nr:MULTISPECIES: hypothetical protein [Burkholderia cepacia complex]MDN7615279.1 hypothetical protein [Burkholderia cepacia]